MANHRSARWGMWLLALVVSAVAFAQSGADNGAAQQGEPLPRNVIVVLDDGQQLVGELVAESADSITLRIGGVNTVLQRKFIERVTTLRPAIERYRSMRAIIDDENIEQLLLLIDWLRAEALYEEALQEVDAILQREPQNGRAMRLRDLVLEQKMLRDSQRDVAGARSTTSPDTMPVRRPNSIDFPLLTEQDMNLLKVYEIDLRQPPRILIERQTIDSLLQRFGGLGSIPADAERAEDFRRLPATRQLEAMFEVRARDLYGEVKVMELPRSLRLFRDGVQTTWLVNSCATTACHGGLDAGEFMLFNRSPNSEAAALTNLVILERARTADGAPLLDYEHPEQSLLLQFALAPRLSTRPHPQVRGWRPVFTSKSAGGFGDTVAWMDAMIRPRPDVPIEYEPPHPGDFVIDPPDSASPSDEAAEPEQR